MKFCSYAITFTEIPKEITLAFQISNCPFCCEGCHSKYLREDLGKEFFSSGIEILEKYKDRITCVCFMGEGSSIENAIMTGKIIKTRYNIKTGLYSGTIGDFTPDKKHFLYITNDGRKKLYSDIQNSFDYIKVGPYISKQGPLNNSNTNQKIYKYENGTWENITNYFWREKK